MVVEFDVSDDMFVEPVDDSVVDVASLDDSDVVFDVFPEDGDDPDVDEFVASEDDPDVDPEDSFVELTYVPFVASIVVFELLPLTDSEVDPIDDPFL